MSIHKDYSRTSKGRTYCSYEERNYPARLQREEPVMTERDKGIDTNLHATKEIGVTTVPVESLGGLY